MRSFFHRLFMYLPAPGKYSKTLCELIYRMLEKDPVKRITIEDIVSIAELNIHSSPSPSTIPTHPPSLTVDPVNVTPQTPQVPFTLSTTTCPPTVETTVIRTIGSLDATPVTFHPRSDCITRQGNRIIHHSVDATPRHCFIGNVMTSV